MQSVSQTARRTSALHTLSQQMAAVADAVAAAMKRMKGLLQPKLAIEEMASGCQALIDNHSTIQVPCNC